MVLEVSIWASLNFSVVTPHFSDTLPLSLTYFWQIFLSVISKLFIIIDGI